MDVRADSKLALLSAVLPVLASLQIIAGVEHD